MPMESYKLTPLTIKSVGRDRPYFDLYTYCFYFRMDELCCVREMDHAQIDRNINHKNVWRQRNPNFGGSWAGRRGDITEEQRANCHAMLDYLQAQQDYKITISTDWGYLYTNDMGLVRRTEQLPYVLPLRITETKIDRPRDTLRILSSQHEFRTYFRGQRLEQRQAHILLEFLRNQQSIRLSPSLEELVRRVQSHYYINENFFIDHDGMGLITMLGLVLPRATRKTVKLIRDK